MYHHYMTQVELLLMILSTQRAMKYSYCSMYDFLKKTNM